VITSSEGLLSPFLTLTEDALVALMITKNKRRFGDWENEMPPLKLCGCKK